MSSGSATPDDPSASSRVHGTLTDAGPSAIAEITAGRIDVHTHLLPGIDDGCPSFEDALECARILVRAGFTHAFCTPHIWPTLPGNTVASVKAWTDALQARLAEANVPLRLAPGGELNLLWGWPALKEHDPADIVTYAFARRYVLFDFWADSLPDFFDAAVRYLQSLGLKVIMAHPERIVALQRDPSLIDRFIAIGGLLQMNTWCLTDPLGSPTRQTAERLLRDGKYFLFGTDCHNAASMPTRIEGISIAESIVGRKEVERLTMKNPRLLLPDEI